MTLRFPNRKFLATEIVVFKSNFDFDILKESDRILLCLDEPEVLLSRLTERITKKIAP